MKEIVAARAHIQEMGKKKWKFEIAASRLNENLRFKSEVNGRTIAEHFKVHIEQFIIMQNADEFASGGAYKFTEFQKLLEGMKLQIDSNEEMKKKEDEKEKD